MQRRLDGDVVDISRENVGQVIHWAKDTFLLLQRPWLVHGDATQEPAFVLQGIGRDSFEDLLLLLDVERGNGWDLRVFFRERCRDERTCHCSSSSAAAAEREEGCGNT